MKTKQAAPVLMMKDFGEDGHFTGYGSVFGNRDSYGDIVQPGAFLKSLADHEEKGSMPKLFWQHDPWKPIGKWLSMEEDATGLKVTGQLNMQVQQGREAYALLKAGDIDGLSIGYRIGKAEDTDDALLLKELDLVEVSVVSLGANDQALVSAVKTIRAGGLPALPEFEKFLREAGFSRSEAKVVATHGLSELHRREAGDSEDEPIDSDPTAEFWAGMANAPIIDLTGEPD